MLFKHIKLIKTLHYHNLQIIYLKSTKISLKNKINKILKLKFLNKISIHNKKKMKTRYKNKKIHILIFNN